MRPGRDPAESESGTPNLDVAPGVFASSARAVVTADDSLPVSASGEAEVPNDGQEHGSAILPEDKPTTDSPDRYLAMHQRQRKQLLADCARLQLFDFQILATPNWPENFALMLARRERSRWLFAMSMLATVFLGGLVSLVPAWVAGPAFGALMLTGSLALPAIRRWITSRGSYSELLAERRQLLRAARKHIAYLEGDTGLAWQCQPLGEYQPSMRQARFQGLFNLSRTGNLASYVRSRSHVRLYLMFLLEAEKAYQVMQDHYLQGQEELREGQASLHQDSAVEESQADPPS